MFRLLAFLLLLVLLTLGGSAERTLGPALPRLGVGKLDGRAIGFARLRRDAPRFAGAWELQSDDPRFGGLSAMTAVSGGLLVLSDQAMAFRIGTAGGQPTALRTLGRIAGPGQRYYPGPSDPESLTACPNSASLWVGFESNHRIWRFDAMLRPQARSFPAFTRRWTKNGGAEAMACLADGRFLIFREHSPGRDGISELWLASGDPTASTTRFRRLRYRGPFGYEPTDAVLLGDGRLAVLHRHFGADGFSAVLSVADSAGLARGTLVSQPLVHLRASWPADNWEALARTRENGRDFLWVATDDNFYPPQRTLLLKLALP